MAGTRAAIRYAKAILDLAGSKNAAAQVNNDMLYIAKTVDSSRELREFMDNPTTTVQAQHDALLAIFPDTHEVTKSLFRLLQENKRFDLLSAVAESFVKLFEEMNGIENALVTTAVPMTDDLRAKVLDKVMSFSDKKVVIENIVDPSIIGGFIIRIGDRQYNASIAGRLQALKREFANS